MEGGLHGVLKRAAVCTGRGRLDLEMEFCERVVMKHVHAVLHDFGERGEDVVDGGGVNIHPANDDHVVGSAENAPMQNAVFVGEWCPDEVAGAVAEDWPVKPAERGKDEFTDFARGCRDERVWMDDFGEVAASEDLECIWLCGREEGRWADLGHSVMIEQQGVGPKVREAMTQAV